MNSAAAKIAQTLLAHLRSTNQLDLLGEVVGQLKQSSEFKHSQNRVVLTSVAELGSADLKSIESYLGKTLSSPYELETRIDPTLIAGFTLEINDTFIDASVLGKISSVHTKLTAKE